MKTYPPKPRKDLDLIPIQHQGKNFVYIRDRLGLVREGTSIPHAVYNFLVLLDQCTDLKEIQLYLTRQNNGLLVDLQQVEKFVQGLDQAYLLESERYQRAKEAIIEEFCSMPQRPSTFQGKSYPDNKPEAESLLQQMLNSGSERAQIKGKIKAIIAPHIDFQAGARVYGSAYNMLPDFEPELVFILGIGHQMHQGLFSLSKKDYLTILGQSKTNIPIVNKLQAITGDCLCPNDFDHRFEHSIEFQVLFLHHLFPGKHFKIVPILCGSLLFSLPEYSRRRFLDKAGPFLEELKKQIISHPRSLVIAGLDLSHIGPKFGHEQTAAILQEKAQKHDQELLQALCDMDPEALWAASGKERDQYNVCGFSALASLLEIMPSSCSGQMLDYDIWHEHATSSAVSFAAAAISKQQS